MSEADRKIRHIIEAYFGEDLDPTVYEVLEPCILRGGEWLFRQGDPGDSLYFVVRGRLQAWASSSEVGERRLLGDLLPGDSVGEAGLLTGESRTAGIRAIRDSLLIRLDHQSFESLAQSHPAMVMRLAANVATMMQKNLAGSGGVSRGFKTIALLTLNDSDLVRDCAGQICQRLADKTEALVIEPARLGELGAPRDHMSVAGELPDALKNWLSDQETGQPMVVFKCGMDETPWTRFALRQADIVLTLADASGDPVPGVIEKALLTGTGAPAGRQALVMVHPAGASISGTSNWLKGRDVDWVLHIRNDMPGDLNRVVRILSGRAVGLVLGAGALRGLAALGVYKAMVEAGVPIDWVGGSSVGSIVAAAIARDWDPGHAINVTRDALVKGKPFSDYTLPVVSLVRGERMMKLLKSLLDTDMEDLPLPYFCVSSNLDSGVLNVHTRGPLVDALRASAAMPGVLPPVVIDSELVVDGGVLNHLPVDVMQKEPVAKIIAVDVSSQARRQVDFENMPSSWSVLLERWLPFGRKRKVPGLATVILRATEIGTLSQSRVRGQLADLLISPPVRQYSMTDIKAFDRIVDAGYRQARADLQHWLSDQRAADRADGPEQPDNS